MVNFTDTTSKLVAEPDDGKFFSFSGQTPVGDPRPAAYLVPCFILKPDEKMPIVRVVPKFGILGALTDPIAIFANV